MLAALFSPKGVVFIAYTALGYVSLIIHQALVVPGMVGPASKAHMFLALANLSAGSWCFLRALRAAWVAGGTLRGS